MASLGVTPISIAGKTGGDRWTLTVWLASLTAMAELIIFDGDGVLIDSEVIRAGMLIAGLHSYGVEMAMAFVSRNFLGRSYPAVLAEVRTRWGIVRPDQFLHAATKMGFAPAACVVIADSLNGVHAELAAGMEVWRFVGGIHLAGLDLETPEVPNNTQVMPILRRCVPGGPTFCDPTPTART